MTLDARKGPLLFCSGPACRSNHHAGKLFFKKSYAAGASQTRLVARKKAANQHDACALFLGSYYAGA